MTHPDYTRDHPSTGTSTPPPASPAMAARLATNRQGKLTGPQHRLALIVGAGALIVFLCPVAMLVQLVSILALGDAPVPTVGGVIFTAIGAIFMLLMVGLIGTNAYTFLREGLMRRPVRYARGPLTVHLTEGDRPELPFSYVIGDYSFAPYVAPRDLPMRTGAPYIVYYGAKSRLLLSIAALDAPDAAQWEPEF